ncbi:MAG: type II toxin-antitoxin system RelE/ParE family toxin [Betaproteobacteria bacterium]|nr:type II toxin-antitoxin system RelE/ParE family toxin [Betaproteobacteria bacterium]
MQPRYSLRIPELVAGFIRKLHPRLKRKLRAALETIAAEPHAGKALRNELEGLRSFRAGKFCLIYRTGADTKAELVARRPAGTHIRGNLPAHQAGKTIEGEIASGGSHRLRGRSDLLERL